MFQDPDEDNHYDYALTLFSAGRPIAPNEGDTQNDTHPTVRYLVDKTNARSLRFDPVSSVPEGYGTFRYFHNLDLGAPRVDRRSFEKGPIRPVPFIAKLYPLGYYTLAAAAIWMADKVSGGSAVAAFFGARLLSVCLLAMTLWLTYRAFDEMAGKKRALLITALTAFFPVYLSVFAGVQPDNLASALVAALWLAALRLLKTPESTRTATLTGLLLAMLIATKWHFFAALALPLYASIAIRWWLRSVPAVKASIHAIFLTVPSAIVLLTTRPYLAVPNGTPTLCPTNLTGALTSTISKGPGYAFHHFVIDGFLYSFTNSLSASNALWSFWLKFGQYGAPIQIGNPELTVFIAILIQIMVVVVSFLAFLRIAQNVFRFAKIWCHRSRSILRIISGDFIVNSYLCYFAVLYAFESYGGSEVVIRGRYWFAFLPAIWYFAVFLAPRALPRRLAVPATALIVGSLVVFEVTGTASAFSSVRRAFYETHAPLSQNEVFARFEDQYQKWPDHVNFGPVKRGEVLLIHGVAMDRRLALPAKQVLVSVDGNGFAAVPTSGGRLACILTETRLYGSGFDATVNTAQLAEGHHHISLLVKTTWSSAPIDSGATGAFTISKP